MRFNIYLFLSPFIIFYNTHELTNAKPMIGQNIRQAQPREYSYVTSIMKVVPGHPQSGGDHFCTGVLITRKDVLTSAHCLEDETLNSVQIVVGTIDLRNGTVYYPYWWITYDQWAVANNITIDYNWNDMANIRLTEKVPRNILSVRLSRLENTELYNAQVTVVGWGLNNQGITPDIMNIADVQIIENIVCGTRLERVIRMPIPINIRLFCSVAEPYVLLDMGDSGGPLIFRNRLIALNQAICPTVNGSTVQNQVNLHIGIHYYRPFISNIKND